ncbi:MAG: hypothetical protein AB9835_02090 [Eubacteriales bacterium]
MCGLFGFSDYGNNTISQLSDLTNALSVESAVRGTDATGIAFVHDNKVEIQKDSKSAYSMTFKLPNGTSCITGHTRHTTQGSEKRKYNNHPFKGRTRKGSHFALSHNGIISNDRSLRKTLSLPATKIETDSFIAVQLLEREKKLSFKSIAKMVEQVTGSYSFSILDDQNNVYLVKGDSPLAILHLTRLKLYVYASTEQILWKALTSSMLKELKDGCFEEITVREGGDS